MSCFFAFAGIAAAIFGTETPALSQTFSQGSVLVTSLTDIAWLKSGFAAQEPEAIGIAAGDAAHAAPSLENLTGNFHGSGRMDLILGISEDFTCSLQANANDAKTQIEQKLKCKSPSYALNAGTTLLLDGEKITGGWSEQTYSAAGRLKGRLTPKGMELTLLSPYFTAKMDIVASKCRWSARAVPTPQALVTSFHARVSKC